ncbi:unnamed protein product [Callosobruchus maculatus]|uniref:Uncharacterized protein n=1 Tax=Callosobruchus maculatus TaxID=64391 RepID=A0A653C068_CALMS|nr:unnamed protein product [Callosobruchus maculatus]
MAAVASTEEVVLTCDEFEEIKTQVENDLKKCLNDPIFIARITSQIAESVAKSSSECLEACKPTVSNS